MRITESVRNKRIANGWIEADWVDHNGNSVIWRHRYGRLSKTATVIGKWVEDQHDETRFKVKHIHWDLFRYKVSRSAINSALKKLESIGLIRKSHYMVGRNRNQEWVVKK